MEEKAVLRKLSWRLLPSLFLLYVANIVDRGNVSFAKLQMLETLDLDEQIYGLGFGMFYVGYLTFEVPSNLILRRVGARRWMGRIMISWGLVASAMMAVQGPRSFYLLRFLLGVTEAGFFPGIILYLTYWFPTRQRAQAVAWFMVASPLTGVLINPVSGALMRYMDTVAGLPGWQWLFLLEGIPAVILGILVLLWLPDRPEEVDWLTSEEQSWLAGQLQGEEKQRVQRHGLSLLQTLTDLRVWLLILLYFTVAWGSNTFGANLPSLIKDRYPYLKEDSIGLLSAIPNLVAIVCMVLNGIHSDRTNERCWHVAIPAFVSSLGWTLCAVDGPPIQCLIGLSLAQAGIMSMLPVFWALPTAFLSGAAAAGGIALINSVGNIGGIVGPAVFGRLAKDTENYQAGLLTTALVMSAGGLLALFLKRKEEAH
jgi:MFS family permease